jgi:uncharacterized protein YhfF
MRRYPLTSQFGWEGDEGLGDALIEQIRRGQKTATCCPVALYTPAELAAAKASAGQPATVLDKRGTPRCNIRVREVFETPYGDPDPRLISGEGYADVAAFWTAHANVWDEPLAAVGSVLTTETPLLVELFTLEDEAPE